MTILSSLFETVGEQLDGIILAYRRGAIPEHPETIVTYRDGTVRSFEIEGELGKKSISNKANAVKVDIGNSVTSIGQQTFYDCSGLTSVTIPGSVTSIGVAAFSGCSGLTEITIGNNVTRIRNYAFQNCSNLTSITIPDSVTSIEIGVFANCLALTSVMIPNSVIGISNYAFDGCPATVTFKGKNKATVRGMTGFRWGIEANKIVCTDGTL